MPWVARLALACVALGSACSSAIVRPAPFRARPDSVIRGDLRGPFTGRVVDLDTDRPVGGALVYASWRFVSSDLCGDAAPAGFREFIGSTDSTGHYVVPELTDAPAGARLSDFRLLVYKRGYAAYRSDRRFDDFGPRTDFTQDGYAVELVRWRPEFSHLRHLSYVGGGPALGHLVAWEVPDAIAELGGKRPASGESNSPNGLSSAALPRLHANALLTPADIKALTGYEGAFDASELGDEPASSSYDTVHLQARGRDEAFDVAMRLWHLPRAEAATRFDKLAEELPGAKVKNEIGDRSLRASTPGGDILGLAFLDASRGVVVLIQCGASQCRTHETVLALARIVKERAESQFSVEEP